MIEINYNEYKETIADNMKLIQENHKLKEIIKEVRELCLMFASGRLERTNYDDILEILDKVDKDV